MKILRIGLRQLFRGARTGQPGLAGLGAVLVILGWSRKRRSRDQKPLYSQKLRKGQAIRIRLLRGETLVGEADVSG